MSISPIKNILTGLALGGLLTMYLHAEQDSEGDGAGGVSEFCSYSYTYTKLDVGDWMNSHNTTGDTGLDTVPSGICNPCVKPTCPKAERKNDITRDYTDKNGKKSKVKGTIVLDNEACIECNKVDYTRDQAYEKFAK